MSFRQIDICPTAIAKMPAHRLKDVVANGEKLVLIQIENLRGIDTRATQIMTGAGLMLSIVFGLVLAFFDSQAPMDNTYLKVFISLASCSGFFSIFICLIIVQSDLMYLTGNDPALLFKDVSDGYSEHESLVDYSLNLSTAKCGNELLIRRNGSRLRWASVFFLAMVILLIASGSQLILT